MERAAVKKFARFVIGPVLKDVFGRRGALGVGSVNPVARVENQLVVSLKKTPKISPKLPGLRVKLSVTVNCAPSEKRTA